jgi:hypothetical protein
MLFWMRDAYANGIVLSSENKCAIPNNMVASQNNFAG